MVTYLEQPGKKRDEVGPFVDTFERLQTSVHLSSVLLILGVGGE